MFSLEINDFKLSQDYWNIHSGMLDNGAQQRGQGASRGAEQVAGLPGISISSASFHYFHRV